MLRFKDHFCWGTRTYVMGILNITPDSFSGDGVMEEREFVASAVKRAVAFQQAGADILDVGGESTRPGAAPVDIRTEIQRVVPVIEAVMDALPEAVVSIDTSKAEVAAAALNAGAKILNDVWALQQDPEIASVAASSGCPVILMHNASRRDAVDADGHGGRRYAAGAYDHLLEDVLGTLSELAVFAKNAGIAEEQIILDPGIGFGKSKRHNLDILQQLHRITQLGFTVMLGTSRKRFMGAICRETEFKDLVGATCATTALGTIAGVGIFRVHDVRENRQAMEVAYATHYGVDAG